tara:strand:+ start:877 stop:1518 length:642 start_codon:yes stop_codon:yes gene_type:complete
MYFDISPTLSADTAVFPGDQKFSRSVSMDFSKGDHLELSSMTTTPHIGAHADAPSHYHKEGAPMDQKDPRVYIGTAQVIHAKATGADLRILKQDVDLSRISAKRVLFYTGSFPNPDIWNNNFYSFAPELLEALADQGVELVGIDTPSVDPWDSKGLESHQVLFKRNLSVLEGLVLEGVPEGIYKLVAPPLKIKDGDASPVRALLFSDQDWARL